MKVLVGQVHPDPVSCRGPAKSGGLTQVLSSPAVSMKLAGMGNTHREHSLLTYLAMVTGGLAFLGPTGLLTIGKIVVAGIILKAPELAEWNIS